jgi:hypothetical protein
MISWQPLKSTFFTVTMPHGPDQQKLNSTQAAIVMHSSDSKKRKAHIATRKLAVIVMIAHSNEWVVGRVGLEPTTKGL